MEEALRMIKEGGLQNVSVGKLQQRLNNSACQEQNIGTEAAWRVLTDKLGLQYQNFRKVQKEDEEGKLRNR